VIGDNTGSPAALNTTSVFLANRTNEVDSFFRKLGKVYTSPILIKCDVRDPQSTEDMDPILIGCWFHGTTILMTDGTVYVL
jgi:hypothetical protein